MEPCFMRMCAREEKRSDWLRVAALELSCATATNITLHFSVWLASAFLSRMSPLRHRILNMYTHPQIDTVLEGCAFFLERSAYHVIQPTQLSAHLQATGMIQSHARAISGVWEAEATGVCLPQLSCSAFWGARRAPLIHTPNDAHP